MWKISIKTLQEFQDNGGGGGGLPCNTSIDHTTWDSGTKLFNGRIKLSLLLSLIKEDSLY